MSIEIDENKKNSLDLLKIKGWLVVLWFFPPLWIILIIVNVRDSARAILETALFSVVLSILSFILGFIALSVANSLEKEYKGLVHNLPIAKLKFLALIIVLLPFVSFTCQLILRQLFPQHLISPSL